MDGMHTQQNARRGPLFHSMAEVACLVRHRQGAAGHRPWLDLMERGIEVEEGPDLNSGDMIKMN